jgi:hypothetical protein
MKKTVLAINPAIPYVNLLKELAEHRNNGVELLANDLHIIQIGAGGTGGYVAYEILRLLGNLPGELKEHIHYTLMDGDMYESKNIGRQLCCEEDIGKFKAQVIIEEYGEIFGVDPHQTTYVNEYLTNINQLYELANMPLPAMLMHDKDDYFDGTRASWQTHNVPGLSVIIIDCVDKNAPRAILHEYFKKMDKLPDPLGVAHRSQPNDQEVIELTGLRNTTRIRDIYIISSGNGKYNGQVSWGRKSFLGTIVKPMYYDDIYGDGDVSSIIGTPISTYVGEATSIVNPTAQAFNQRRLEVLATDYYLAKTNVDLVRNGGVQFRLPKVITANTYLVSLPIPIANLENREINVRHPMLRNINMFMSTFMSTNTPYDRFPELTDLEADNREEALSCAERAEINVQSITANKTAAAIVINYFTMIFNGMYPLEKDIPVLATETTRFNILTGEYSSDPITTESLRKVQEETGEERIEESEAAAE